MERSRSQIMNQETMIEFDNPDFIVTAKETKHSDRQRTIFYGDDRKNILEVTINDYGIIEGFDLIYTKEAREGKSPIDRDPLAKRAVAGIIEYDDTEESNYTRNDFQFYYNENDITIVINDQRPVEKYYQKERIEYGLDKDNNPLYFRVKDLNQKEYQNLEQGLAARHIPMTTSFSWENKNDYFTKVEEQENVKMLLACGIGSHAWGYANPNSDFDLRFVYARPYKEYESSQQPKSTISYPITEGLDIVGYDLSRFLSFINSQNITAYEMLYSPSQFRDSEYLESLRKYAEEIINPDKLLQQYQKLYQNRVNDILDSDKTKVKTYLYNLRLIGMINYIQENKKFPRCDLNTLFESKENKYLSPLVKELTTMRSQGIEEVLVGEPDKRFLTQEKERIAKIPQKEELNSIPNNEAIQKLYIAGLEYANNQFENSKNVKPKSV